MSKEKIQEEVKEKNKSGMCIAALTLGIVSIVLNWFWYISLPAGILAIVFGAKTTKKLGSKLGKAGLITGIIGVSLCVFAYITVVLLAVLSSL